MQLPESLVRRCLGSLLGHLQQLAHLLLGLLGGGLRAIEIELGPHGGCLHLRQGVGHRLCAQVPGPERCCGVRHDAHGERLRPARTSIEGCSLCPPASCLCHHGGIVSSISLLNVGTIGASTIAVSKFCQRLLDQNLLSILRGVKLGLRGLCDKLRWNLLHGRLQDLGGILGVGGVHLCSVRRRDLRAGISSLLAVRHASGQAIAAVGYHACQIGKPNLATLRPTVLGARQGRATLIDRYGRAHGLGTIELH
mmetsp:Transcript_60344/g.155511  ORF Transcript_60344/g.155511 Transcript_60344/m.155511 type:complete len:252 (-) Transcript_60344:252-1007(-)